MEHPRPEQDADEPAIAIARLLRLTEVNPIIEQPKHALPIIEMPIPRRRADREPHPIHREQTEENHNREAEVILQESWVPDIGDDSEEHAD